MTRLVYKQVPNTKLLIVANSVLCNNKSVNVSLNTETLVYIIYEMTGLLATGQGKTLTEAKKKIKRDLTVMGANFDQEIRNRGKTKKL